MDKYVTERNVEIERIKEIAAKVETLQKLQALHNKSASLSKSFQKRVVNQVVLDLGRDLILDYPDVQ